MPDPIPSGAAAPAGTATPAPGSKPAPAATPAPGSATPAAGAQQQPAGSQPPAQQAGGNTVPLSALMEEREKRQQLQSRLEALETRLGGQPSQYQQQPQQPAQPDYRQQIDKLWENDPRQAVAAEIMAALSWYDQVNTAVDMQEAQVSAKYNDFGTYRNEVRNYIRSLPHDQRARPGVVELAYYAVRGQKVDDIIRSEKERIEKEYLARFQAGELGAALPPGGMSQPPSAGGQVTLTPDQKSACAALGISESDYVKYMQVK